MTWQFPEWSWSKHSAVSPTAVRSLFWVLLDIYTTDIIVCLQCAPQRPCPHILTEIPRSKSGHSCSPSPRAIVACTFPALKEIRGRSCAVYLGSMRILETPHLALLIENLSFECNGMHTLWYCASIWRKITVEQLISYMSIFSKETWDQAVKTRNLAMEIRCSHLQKIVQAATSQQCKETDLLLMHGLYQLLYIFWCP